MERFIRGVLVPAMFREDSIMEVVYQAEPALRVHLPDSRVVGMVHCDSDYYHQPGEINYWWPVGCRVEGTNSLHSESRPGEADFHDFRLDYGEVMRFYGNKCRHYTLPNETGRTRVSIDVRVIRREDYLDTYYSGKSRESVSPFKLGGFYKSL